MNLWLSSQSCAELKALVDRRQLEKGMGQEGEGAGGGSTYQGPNRTRKFPRGPFFIVVIFSIAKSPNSQTVSRPVNLIMKNCKEIGHPGKSLGVSGRS